VPEQLGPGDIPADADPVCGRCRRPVEWNGIRGGWEHAETADALFCSIFTGTPVIIEEDENA
jgi:hypothetical protein